MNFKYRFKQSTLLKNPNENKIRRSFSKLIYKHILKKYNRLVGCLLVICFILNIQNKCFGNNKTHNVLQHSYFQQFILTSTCRSMSMKSSFKLILSLQRSVTSQWTISSLLTKCFMSSHMQGSSSLSILYLSVLNL